MKMLAASKRKRPNRHMEGNNMVRNIKMGIIALQRSAAVQTAQQIYDGIMQTKGERSLRLKRTHRGFIRRVANDI